MDLKNHSNGKIALEVLGNDGRPICCHPIDVNELLRERRHDIHVGDGVHVRLEECNSDIDASSYSFFSDEYEDTDEESTTESDTSDGATYGGTTVVQEDTISTTSYGAVDSTYDQKNAYLQRLSMKNSNAALAQPRSRRDIWLSFAPPIDPDRNYKYMQSTSLMPSATSKRFRLPPLMYHSASSYLDPSDQGQRILVYGGISSFKKSVENEMYEFSLLSGNWWRVEGKQVLSAGNYGHTAVAVSCLQCLVVIGGIGPGGQPVHKDSVSNDLLRARYSLLFPCKENVTERHHTPPSSKVTQSKRLTLCSLETPAQAEQTVGFLPLLFHIRLGTFRWRVIKTACEILLAFHTAVASTNNIYVFGGVTNRLTVSSQLIWINAKTYAISSICPSSTAAPKARYLHSAVVYGNWMLIYGGFDACNEPLSDVWAFDMVNERWEELECQGTPARGGHTACVVGSRLITVGGFDAAIGTGQQLPTSKAFELQLVPTTSGKYIWKELVVRPAVPPLAFAVVCNCADDASFILYGGCTVAQKSEKKHQQHAEKATLAVLGGEKFNAHAKAKEKMKKERCDVKSNFDDDSFWRMLTPVNEGFAFTFPAKKTRNTSLSFNDEQLDANGVGSHADFDDLTPEFKTFVRRQQEFISKKKAQLAQTIKKTTLEELESMETRLFLTPEEIEQLLSKSNLLCESFTSYDMKMISPSIPEREDRLRFNEECIYLSRQLRDVILSMQSNESGAATVRSKRQGAKSGQKLVDYCAPKPFRRALVMSLVKEMKMYLKRLFLLNKSLKMTVWDGKQEYMDAVKNMKNSLDEFVQTAKSILERYIQHRVELLMSALTKRKENMLRLTEIVEKSRRDEGLQVGGLHRQRSRSRRALKKDGETQYVACDYLSRPSSCSRICSSSCHTGAGYYKDERQAVIFLQPKELEGLLKKLQCVQKASASLCDYCRLTLSSSSHFSTSLEGQKDDVLRPESIVPPSGSLVCPATPSLNVPTQSGALTDAAGAVSPTNELVVHHSDMIRRLAIRHAKHVGETINAFVMQLKGQPVKASATVEQEKNDFESKKQGTPLYLSYLRPFLLCRAKLDGLQKSMLGLRLNFASTESSEATPVDVEAVRRFQKLLKGVSAIAQYFTANFLTSCGAKKSFSRYRRPQHIGVSSLVSAASCKRSCSASSPSSRIKRHTSKGILEKIFSNNVVGINAGNITTEEQQAPLQEKKEEEKRQEQQMPITFTAISPLLISRDPSFSHTLRTMAEIEHTISLTSGEAKALVEPLLNPNHRTNSSVIVASSKNTQVIPNSQAQLTFQSGGTQGTEYNPTAGDAVYGSSAVVANENLSPPRIVLSHGPQAIAAPTSVNSVTSLEMSPFMHKGLAQGSDKVVSTEMVSFSPGSFKLYSNQYHATPSTAEKAAATKMVGETYAIPRSCTAALDEDYFCFGRRYASDLTTDLCITAAAAVKKRTTANACVLTISPPVGVHLGHQVSLPRRQTPRSLLSHRRSRSLYNVADVAVKPARRGSSGVFRGRLTPGEKLILQAREHRVCAR